MNPFPGYATNLDDNYYFDFGNYSLKIYNTHIVANQMENLNSSPVLVTHKITGKKIAILGDIQDHTSEYEGYTDGQYIRWFINSHMDNIGYTEEDLWADDDGNFTGKEKTDELYAKVLKYSMRQPFGDCYECTTLGEENQIADIIGKVDVVKAAHHGYNSSNSYYSIFKYRPSYIIYSKNKDKMYTYLNEGSSKSSSWKHSSAIALLSYTNLETKHYSTYQVGNNKGMVLTFDDATNDIKFKALNSSGNVVDKSYSNIATNIIKTGSYKDTEKWYWNHNTNSTDAARIYIDADGKLTTGWLEYNDNWYYFSKAEGTKGLMLKGLRNLSYNSVKDTYYLTPKETDTYPEGAMQYGGFTEVDGDYYYFRTAKDDVSEGPKGAAITGWYTKGSKKYYFRQETDEYGTGRKGSALKDTCVVMGNYKYCFNSSGVQTSKTAVTSVTIPTDSMCNDLAYTGSEQTLTKDPVTGYTWSNNKGTNVGDYTVQAVLIDGYKWSDDTLENKSIVCEIKKGERTAPTVVSYEGHYDGNSHTITVTGEGTFEYSLDNETWTGEKPTRKSIGTTTVYVRVKEDDNYNASEVVTGTIKINEAPLIEVTIPTDIMCNDLIYNGNSQTLTKEALEGYTWNNNTGINAGYYTVQADLKNGYIWEDNTLDPKEIICNIKKADVADPTVTSYSGVYDGQSHTITIGQVSGGTLNYSLDNETWTEDKPTRTNAGTTTVYVKVIGDNNHKNSTVVTSSIKITKANRQKPTVTSYSGVYDEDYHTIIATGEGTIEYSRDNVNWSTAKPVRKDIGTTTVYVRIQGDDNYNASEVVTGTITISEGEGYNIDDYTIDEVNNYISDITINTDLDSFKNHITLETGFTVEVDTKTVNSKKLLYTGGKTKIYKNGVIYKEFTNTVVGDPSGDGVISYLDYVKVYNHIQKTKNPSSSKQLLQGVYLLAADMSKDNKITYLDYVKIYNKIKELKGGTN